jgi:hypothetical protein
MSTESSPHAKSCRCARCKRLRRAAEQIRRRYVAAGMDEREMHFLPTQDLLTAERNRYWAGIFAFGFVALVVAFVLFLSLTGRLPVFWLPILGVTLAALYFTLQCGYKLWDLR